MPENPQESKETAAQPRRFLWTNFRSTLEADWAATLTHYGIAWQYEPRIIRLPSGATYIPDFWLPRIGTWIEVKGPGIPREEKAEELAETLACTCPPPPDPCTCEWEGGAIVLIGRPPIHPAGTHLRFGAAYWSGVRGAAMFTACARCDNHFWIQPRYSLRCRHCRTYEPRAAHLKPLLGTGSPDTYFCRADRVPEYQLPYFVPNRRQAQPRME